MVTGRGEGSCSAQLLVSPLRALASLSSPAGIGCAAGTEATRLGSARKKPPCATGQRVFVQKRPCGGGGGCGGCGGCGSDDSGDGVSVQARSYVQLIQRQHTKCCRRLKASETLPAATDPWCLTNSSTNPCARKKERRQIILNPQQPSTLRYLPFPSLRRWKITPRNKSTPDSETLTCDTNSFRWTLDNRIMIRKMNTGSRTGTNHRIPTREIRHRPRGTFLGKGSGE